MKKVLSLFLVAVMVVSMFAGLQISSSALEPSGKCGEKVNWSFDKSTGTLTISGKGKMNDYDETEYYSPFYYHNSDIVNVIIENGVTSIGSCAFSGCSSLTSITIPNSVTSIGSYAFYNCSGLAIITVAEGNTVYDSRNNCNAIIETKSNTLIQGCKNTIIPDTVEAIDSEAFRNCSGLTSITIPNSVTAIGETVFSGCDELESITVAEDNTIFDSRNNCNAIIITESNTLIQGCKNTIIPNSVTSINDHAFWGCSSLTSITIPDSVTSIGWQAFCDCSGLTGITIPDSITSIGGSAFSGCSSLTSITIPDSVTSIGNQAFSGCSGLKELTMPCSAKISNSGYTFGGCTNIEKVTLTKGTGTMQNYSTEYTPWFISRNNLKTLVIEDGVTNISDCAFYDCSSLTSITIPDSVTSIGDSAFEYCSGLTSITIPDSVTSIGNWAFSGCSSLTNVTIGNSVERIDYEAFDECFALQNVNYSGTAYDWNEIYIDGDNECLTSATIHYNYVPFHVHDYKAVITAPTCTEQGYTTHTCACGDSYKDTYVDARGHDFSDNVEFCRHGCGTANPDYVPPHVHSYTDVVTPPTCTEKGFTTHTCECGDVKVDTYVPALGHDFSDNAEVCRRGCGTKNPDYIPPHIHSYTYVVTQPTCTEQGYTTHTCECGDVKVDTYVPALGHYPVTDAAVAPTCTQTGLTEGAHCSRCNAVITAQKTVEALGHDFSDNAEVCRRGCGTANPDYIPPHVHSYTDVVTAPTCTEQGYTTHTCECGDVKVDTYLPALGHDFSDNAEVCRNGCGTKNPDYIPPHIHSYTYVVTQPTCTEQGYTTHTCECGDVKVDTYVPALGHDPVTDAAVAPTCTQTGLTEGAHCSRCNAVITAQKTVEALGHDFSDNAEVCRRGCGTANPDYVAPHVHAYTDVVTAPTCTEQGYTTHTCECGDVIVDTYVSALGHTVVNDKAVAATCTKTGKTAGTHCSVCGEVLTAQTVTKALGHKWDAGKVTKKATPTATGIKTYTCKVCKAKKTSTIAKCAKYANTLTVKGKKVNASFAKLKKANLSFTRNSVLTISKAQGKLTYAKTSGNKSISINKTKGTIQIKKGIKKGTYKIGVKVTATGNATYKSASKTATITVVVK